MKETLASKCGDAFRPFLSDGVLPPDKYKKTLKSLHTKAVKEVIRRQDDNFSLDDFLMEISHSESKLLRSHHSVLAQLRSSYCQRLQSYKHQKLKSAPNALCPECLINWHTTRHLFDCDAATTDLDVASLWSHPIDAAAAAAMSLLFEANNNNLTSAKTT